MVVHCNTCIELKSFELAKSFPTSAASTHGVIYSPPLCELSLPLNTNQGDKECLRQGDKFICPTLPNKTSTGLTCDPQRCPLQGPSMAPLMEPRPTGRSSLAPQRPDNHLPILFHFLPRYLLEPGIVLIHSNIRASSGGRLQWQHPRIS